MAVPNLLMTNEEYYEFVARPENETRSFELINGVIVEMPSASPLHAVIVAHIVSMFLGFVTPRNLGYVVGDNSDFTLAPGYIFQPDIAFIAKARLPKLPRRFELAPDLAVEVVSPSNAPIEILNKVKIYLQYGTQIVWVAYPDEKVVLVYRLAADGSLNLQQFNADQTLDGGDVLPGFSVAVRDLFPAVEVEEEAE